MIRGLVAFRKDTMASAVRLLARAGVAVAVTIGLAGCWTIPVQNPNFPATEREIDADIARMEREPVRLERPVIVLSGYRSPHPEFIITIALGGIRPCSSSQSNNWM